MDRVSVVIPAFNEEGAIAATVEQVRRMLTSSGIEGEVIVVDDGSADRTAPLAEAAGARVFHHAHNIGYGKALKTGMAGASHDTIVITDADGTYPIDRIPDLLAEKAKGFDMVVGARTGAHYRGSHLKWPLRLLLKLLVEWAAGRHIPDINSGLRVFSREAARPYLDHLCDTFSFTTSLTLAFMMTGKFVGYLPIAYHARTGNSKVSLWRDSLKTLTFVMQAILYYSPMKIFFVLVGLCLLSAGISVVIGITFHLATGFMMGVGSLLTALIIFSLGLMADLLKQILSK